MYFIEKPENPDVGQVDLGDRGGCGSCQGWRGTKRGEFRWFPVDTERENENFQVRSCAFLGQELNFKNVASWSGECVSDTISGAGGANPPRRLVLVVLELF